MMENRISASPAFSGTGIGVDPFLVLGLSLLACWILPAELLTALFGGLVLLYALNSPSIAVGAAFRIGFPFLAMAAWALVLSSGNDRFIVGKDLWYAGKIALCLAVGFLVGVRCRETRRFLDVIILVSAITALGTILLWLIGGGSVGEVDGEGSARLPLVATAAIIPLLDRAWKSVGLERSKAIAVLLLITVAIVLSNSRITIIAAGVMVLAAAGIFSRTWRTVIGGGAVVIIVALLWQYLPEYQRGGELTVANKLRRSLDEVLFTDNIDATQMLLNWRGFEAYNAQLMFDQSSLFRKFFGQGLGSVVDLGEEVEIGSDKFYRFLPILHNGFYYIVIKYGLLGILFYVYSVLKFGLLGRMSLDHLAAEDRILRGTIITVLLATAVITGLYNKTELSGLTVLLGWLIGHAQICLLERTTA